MSKGPAPQPPQEPVRLPKGFKGQHPGWSAYKVYGCRCIGCQIFVRTQSRKSYAVRRGRMGDWDGTTAFAPKPLPRRHKGSLNYYNRGCRCGRCCAVRAAYDRRRWWARRFPGTPYEDERG